MTRLIKVFARLLWHWSGGINREAGDAAVCLGIEMSSCMSDRDLRELADYYRALLENRAVHRAKEGGA